MAITSLNMSCDKVPSECSGFVPISNNSSRFLNFPPDGSLSSKFCKLKRNTRSPYLPGDRVQLFSRLTEKRFIHNTNIVSSFPLAMDLYKTNSDDFKPPKKAIKKVKKSVLTLPNDPTPVPHVCTVSDMNDSEYFDKNEDQKRKVVKKQTPTRSKRKARVRQKDFEFYDRDAQYCSQLNLNLNCSSTDMMKNFNGDGRRVPNKKKNMPSSNKTQTASSNLSDVWAVLRNVNRLQFRPSPPMSEDSILPAKKKLIKKFTGNRKESRVIGTCRTQEFAYISSFEVNKKSTDASQSSSTDRITVIDNQDDFSKICEEFEKRLLLTHDFLKDSNNSKNIIQKNIILCKNPRSNGKASGKIVTKDNTQLMIKKKINNFSRDVQQFKNAKFNNSSGKDSLAKADTLQSDDKTGSLSPKTANSVVVSDNSSSSQAEVPNKMNERVSKNDLVVSNKDFDSSAGTTIPPKALDPQPRKLRLVTTMPSSFVIPKLTQTEIRRRLATIKFPVVVLGKDQVSPSIKVKDYDHPQFNGLDDHIWPFMMEWSENIPEELKRNMLNRNCQSYFLDSNSSSEIKGKTRKVNTEVGTYKQKAATWKDKKEANNDYTTNKIKAKIKPTTELEKTEKSIQIIKKQKSIVQLKDKMLNFLYKKSSNLHCNNESYQNNEMKPLTISKNSVIAEIKDPDIISSQLTPDKVLVRTDLPEKKALLAKVRNKKAPIYKYSWAKAKWASDFIENVMKKVRSGVYYTQDRMDFHQTHHADLKEVSVQAGSICDSTDFTQNSYSETDFTFNETKDTRRNSLPRIPGFDNTLPLLEIKTLNMNQIAVKHCVTNSMVQFDVTIPVVNDQNITSVSTILPFTPIAVTDSQTVVYKCTTTILNAILPAELCSILPKMMSIIIDSNKNVVENSALCPTKTTSWLSTISEMTRYGESPSIITIVTSPEIREMLKGRFSNTYCNKVILNKIDFKVKYDQCMITELAPIVPLALLNNLLKYKEAPLLMEIDNSQYTQSQVSLHPSNKQITDVTGIQNTSVCTTMDMDMYNGNYKKFTSAFKPNKLVHMIQIMMRNHKMQINLNLSTYLDMLKLQYDGKNVKINMSLTNDIGDHKEISVIVSNLNIDSLYKAFPKLENYKKQQSICNRNSSPLECIEYVNTALERKSQNTERTQVALSKIKRKGFFKLYRKCKTTSIVSSGEKCTCTTNIPINTITTADDFFQILGSKKVFSSVLDENTVKKILSSVTEMKTWTLEINPKQALLILLLANKKDTQNLVRFRPIILQGIAVNRITRASELDMEIEVIDRENFNKLSQQCEGITYLPETVTDYENLLDELYWIAKTTASDYNKPFNESSERLLKSLLQKRKKLNPSYLRVMARYVGLGLVKTPTEC